MIAGLLEWFGGSPFPYYVVALAALFVFLGLTIIPASRATERFGFECAFLAGAGLTLLAWRWPTFLWENPLNPDEGLWVAGALKVTADWVPWRGFDGTTSGPLTAYTLALPRIFGGRIDFFSTRLIGVCLLTATMAGLYYSVRWLGGTRLARLAVFPAVLILALTKDWNFLHFSSELVPIFLTTTALAASAYLAREGTTKRCRMVACAIAGLCLGSSGIAKLQAAPIAVVILIIALAAIALAHWPGMKAAVGEVLLFLCALCFVPAVIAIALWTTGTWEYAILSYVRKTAGYIEQGARLGPSFLFNSSASYTAFLVSSLIILAVGSATLLWQRHRLSPRSICIVGASILLLVATGFAIFTPHRPYQHYLLFSIVPLSCCVAALLSLVMKTNLWTQREPLITGSYVGLFLISALSVAMASGPHTMVTEIVSNSKTKKSRQAVAIARYAPPGTRVAIWGSSPEYYVQTQTIMATRFGYMAPVPPGPMQEYYQRRMMNDLEASAPGVFVDAVHPGAFVYRDRTTQGYQTFPVLADYVREHYEFKEEVLGVRIFARSSSSKSNPAGIPNPSEPGSGDWKIHFTKEGGSEIYRLSGWSGSEAEFTWTEGTVADLALPLGDNTGALSLEMKLGGLIHPPELTVQNVAVYANGQKIADWEVRAEAIFTVSIPAELTRNAPELKIQLRIPNAASPQSLGLSTDNRMLGIRVYFVELRRR
ncbi:MAG: hypothetical protein QOH88_2910 [Verrucomicrobiota bacterium]|jgi:hypothetical protein